MVPTTLGTGLLLAALCFFGGSGLARIFATDAATIYYAAGYLKGFAADVLIGCLVLMMLGCFNGGGHSTFVMLQGLSAHLPCESRLSCFCVPSISWFLREGRESKACPKDECAIFEVPAVEN